MGRRKQQAGRAYQGWNPQQEPEAHQKGGDLSYTMEVSWLEAINGTEAKVSISRQGKTESIQVKVPAGMQDGDKIRLAGKGEGSLLGGYGDLYITLKVAPHPYFERQGDDIILRLPITFYEAVLGAEIKVPTVLGPVTLKIPAGTSSGSKLRLKGRGAPHQKGKESDRGDQYVIPEIVLPREGDAELKQLAQNFSDNKKYDPRATKFHT